MAGPWFHGHLGVKSWLLCDLVTVGKGAGAISLSRFSPFRSESGQTVRWKNRAQEGKWKSLLPHTFSALPLLELS